MSDDVVYWRKTTVVMKCIATSLLFLCRQEMNETGRRSGGSPMFQNTEESHLKAGWHPQSWWNTHESLNTLNTNVSHWSVCRWDNERIHVNRKILNRIIWSVEYYFMMTSWQVSSTLSTVKSQVTCTALFSSHYHKHGFKKTGSRWR